jgi:phosphate transport system substrate-binding protein
MSKQNSKQIPWQISAGIAFIVLLPLGWALLLLIRGIAQLNQASNIPSDRSVSGSFSEVRNVPAGLFSYGGSASWASIRQRVDSVISSERPEFQLRYVQPSSGLAGSGQGIQMLLDDQLSFVQTSRPLLQSEYALAQQRDLALEQIPVAIDAIAFVVHPGLEVSGLTLKQLRQIYSGQVENWKQLGGPDLAIVPLSRPASTDGIDKFFAQDLMRGESFGSKVKFISTSTEALRQLIHSPGGIYYDSASNVVPQCNGKPLSIRREPDGLVSPYQEPYVPSVECPRRRNSLNLEAFQTGRYALTRYLYVVIKNNRRKNNRTDEQAGKAYANFLLTSQGQSLIAKAGFVRIRR